jgi:hypothetical protein
MKAKIISAVVLLIAVVCFTIFLFTTIGDSDHGKITTSGYMTSIECIGWSVGSWARTTCENVTTKVERFQDGHVEITNIKRTPIKPSDKKWPEDPTPTFDVTVE